jgi:hypothetical protein
MSLKLCGCCGKDGLIEVKVDMQKPDPLWLCRECDMVMGARRWGKYQGDQRAAGVVPGLQAVRVPLRESCPCAT